jgi:hypothetical protein
MMAGALPEDHPRPAKMWHMACHDVVTTAERLVRYFRLPYSPLR